MRMFPLSVISEYEAHIIITILTPLIIGSYEVTVFSVSLVEEFDNEALKY